MSAPSSASASASASSYPSLSSLIGLLYTGYTPKENGTNSKPHSALETAFGKVQDIEQNTILSQQAIKQSEFQIARHKQLIEQDKIDRELAVKNLLEQAAKFNQEHPNDPLDMSLDASIMYKQYLFLKEKFAFKASTGSTPVVPSTGPIPTNSSDSTGSTMTEPKASDVLPASPTS